MRPLSVRRGMRALAAFAITADPKFRRERYHKPSDDLSQPIAWPVTAPYLALAADFVRAVASDPTAPAWLPGDFFGELFGKPCAPKS